MIQSVQSVTLDPASSQKLQYPQLAPVTIPAKHQDAAHGRASHRVPKVHVGEQVTEPVAVGPSSQNSAAVAALLGRPKFLRAASLEMLGVHNAIVRGLPASTLVHLKRSLVCLAMVDLARALGVSERTILRHIQKNSGRLETELGCRVWRFAELLVRATMVFGDQEKAERWLSSNVMGLDGWRPIDLLQTSLGAQLADEFLGRLEYGVYT